VVDTTGDHHAHQRYRLSFAEDDRVARYAQLAILKPYRKRGIMEMLIEAAQRTVIHSNDLPPGGSCAGIARAFFKPDPETLVLPPKHLY